MSDIVATNIIASQVPERQTVDLENREIKKYMEMGKLLNDSTDASLHNLHVLVFGYFKLVGLAAYHLLLF